MSIHQNISFCSYNTLVLKYPYDGKDDYTRKAKNGVLFGEDLHSRYGNRIANKISHFNCDCVALQEVNKACFDVLAEKLWQKGYTGLFSNRNNGEDEGLAIFFKTHRFNVISNHTHYFNDGSGRGILDVGLEVAENHDVAFHVMTSHIDYRMHHIQQEFNIFADYASKIAGPKIVCGDFNVTCEHPYLLPMWDKQFKDSLYGRHAPTFFSDRRIDYILTSPEVNSVFDSKVIGDPQKLYSAEEPSDHLPLLTTIYLRADSNPLKKARIIVKCDAGFGNKLFIRGNGPGMSWERGTELRNIDKETWIFETQNDLSSFEYKVCKVLFNHAEIWETGHNHKTEWNKKQEIFPKFLT